MSQALFYPWIDIHDEAWLKTAFLYWDSVRTIVPESIDEPYSTDTGRALSEAQFLVPLRVHSGMHEIAELTDDVLAYLESAEGAELLISERSAQMHEIHVEKLSHRLGELAEIHPEKLPYEISHILRELASPSKRGAEWIRVNEAFADYYMTLLASRLAGRIGARLLTSLPAADKLAVTARLDAQLAGLLPWGVGRRRRPWQEYQAFGPPHSLPRHLASGMLANLAIERVGIAPDTTIGQLIDFRKRHRDELAQFQAKIEQLAASVEEDLPAEALRQRISDVHAREVMPAISNLKAALEGRRIRWLSEGLLKVAFLSVGPSTMLAMAGLAMPTALLAGAGISLVATKIMYNADRRESLRANPFAYLHSMERELSQRAAL